MPIRGLDILTPEQAAEDERRLREYRADDAERRIREAWEPALAAARAQAELADREARADEAERRIREATDPYIEQARAAAADRQRQIDEGQDGFDPTRAAARPAQPAQGAQTGAPGGGSSTAPAAAPPFTDAGGVGEDPDRLTAPLPPYGGPAGQGLPEIGPDYAALMPKPAPRVAGNRVIDTRPRPAPPEPPTPEPSYVVPPESAARLAEERARRRAAAEAEDARRVAEGLPTLAEEQAQRDDARDVQTGFPVGSTRITRAGGGDAAYVPPDERAGLPSGELLTTRQVEELVDRQGGRVDVGLADPASYARGFLDAWRFVEAASGRAVGHPDAPPLEIPDDVLPERRGAYLALAGALDQAARAPAQGGNALRKVLLGTDVLGRTQSPLDRLRSVPEVASALASLMAVIAAPSSGGASLLPAYGPEALTNYLLGVGVKPEYAQLAGALVDIASPGDVNLTRQGIWSSRPATRVERAIEAGGGALYGGMALGEELSADRSGDVRPVGQVLAGALARVLDETDGGRVAGGMVNGAGRLASAAGTAAGPHVAAATRSTAAAAQRAAAAARRFAEEFQRDVEKQGGWKAFFERGEMMLPGGPDPDDTADGTPSEPASGGADPLDAYRRGGSREEPLRVRRGDTDPRLGRVREWTVDDTDRVYAQAPAIRGTAGAVVTYGNDADVSLLREIAHQGYTAPVWRALRSAADELFGLMLEDETRHIQTDELIVPPARLDLSVGRKAHVDTKAGTADAKAALNIWDLYAEVLEVVAFQEGSLGKRLRRDDIADMLSWNVTFALTHELLHQDGTRDDSREEQEAMDSHVWEFIQKHRDEYWEIGARLRESIRPLIMDKDWLEDVKRVTGVEFE